MLREYFYISNRRDWIISVLFIMAIYLSLIYDLPANIPYSPHDDDLFISQASSILSGNWLGHEYGKFTLIKGPYHSIQIGISSVFGVPPLLGLRIFYAATCALFCSVALSRSSTFLKSLALACLLFDPVLIGTYDGWRLQRVVSFVPIEVLALSCGICALDTLGFIGSYNPASRLIPVITGSMNLFKNIVLILVGVLLVALCFGAFGIAFDAVGTIPAGIQTALMSLGFALIFTGVARLFVPGALEEGQQEGSKANDSVFGGMKSTSSRGSSLPLLHGKLFATNMPVISSYVKNEDGCLMQKKCKKLWISLVLSYFFLGLLLITREARIIVMFTTLVYTFVLAMQAYKYHFLSKKKLLKLVPIAFAVLLFFNLPVVSVKALNYRNYGLAISNEFEEGGFKALYQKLSSVKLVDGYHQPFIPIKKDAIGAIISLEPDSKIANTLSNLNDEWTSFGCQINKDWCDEYSSAWFLWALRDAIFQASSIDSPADFQGQVSILKQDLIRICNSYTEVLTCQASSLGYLPYPSRWVPRGQSPFKPFADASLAHLSRLTSPHPKNSYAAVTHNDEQARSVGVRLTSLYSPAELKIFKQRIVNFNQFSSLMRKILFISFAVILLAIITKKPRLIVCLLDPGLVFIATLLLANFLVIVLVEVTSFPSSQYLSMVSPLTTLYIWRCCDRWLINFKSKPSSNVNNLMRT